MAERWASRPPERHPGPQRGVARWVRRPAARSDWWRAPEGKPEHGARMPREPSGWKPDPLFGPALLIAPHEPGERSPESCRRTTSGSPCHELIRKLRGSDVVARTMVPGVRAGERVSYRPWLRQGGVLVRGVHHSRRGPAATGRGSSRARVPVPGLSDATQRGRSGDSARGISRAEAR